jgi:heptosyltransferase-2
MSEAKAVNIPEGATWIRFPRFVGDAVMQLPILRLLRQIGIGPLVVWGPASAVSLVEENELADAVFPDEGKPGPFEMAKSLRRYRAARSIHFPKTLRPALAAFLARVPERIGVDESLAGLFNTHSAPFWDAEGPFLLRYHAALAKRWPDLPPMPFADYDPGLSIPKPSRPYICLMPGSTWPSKAWPTGHFSSIAAMAISLGMDVVVLGTPNEMAICEVVAGDRALNLCGKTTLKEAAAWLRGAWGAVGNDSGLSHLAAACGTPIVALYGATDPGGSTPWGPRVRGLKRDGLPCAPCFKRECVLDGHPCLQGLPPEKVWQTLNELVGNA